MRLTEHQCYSTIFVECTPDELGKLPKPDHVSDFQTGALLVEYQRTTPNVVALMLNGLRPALMQPSK